MKTKLHTFFLYPLVLIFSTFLKGKKSDFKEFLIGKKNIKQQETLEIFTHDNKFYENIELFFNKLSPLYDKTFVLFELNINKPPEQKKYFAFDFIRVVNIYYTLSMLSARVTNKNIDVGFTFKKQKLVDSQVNNFLRYSLLAFASKKIDTLSFDKEILKDEKSVLAYETMRSYINNSTITNFSNAKNLYVITCTKEKKSFDIIWSSNDDIELTEFGKVYDKYGKLLTKDIKISTSPIYAFHK